MALRFFSRGISGLLTNATFRHVSCHRSMVPNYSTRQFHLSAGLLELVRFNLADIGEGIKEVTIKEWYIKVGDKVSQFDSICEVQSDKAAVTITSRYDGVVCKIYHDINAVAQVGKPLVDIEISGGSSHESTPAVTQSSHVSPVTTETHSSSSSSSSSDDSDGPVLTTPAVRRLAKENNINLSAIRGTGPSGRILKEDLLLHLSSTPSTQQHGAPSSSIPTPIQPLESVLPKINVRTSDQIVKLNPLQKAMFKSMTLANNIPHFNFCDEVDMTKLSEIKKQISVDLNRKISFMPFFIKAASVALLKYPQLNAQLDEGGESLIVKASHNIGFALSTPQGLVVPKIHSVQSKSLLQISDDLQALIERGKLGKLTQTDLADGTFTLSNIGNVGGTYTKPVILPPELVIGGIGRIQRLPRYGSKGYKLVSREIMNISWSADHRAVDGMTLALFSNEWREFLERPEVLMLHLR